MNKLILAIDQGTSGSKAVVINSKGEILSDGRAPLLSSFPEEGFVEQNPGDIYNSVISAVKNALNQLDSTQYSVADIQCCGISNQRETFLLWDKSGKAITPAIVWQCKRSVSICSEMLANGDEPFLRKKTGLFVDPYFSGTKLLWLYKHDEKIRSLINRGEIYFGTIDTWLLYKLTKGEVYKTDYTNASRTLLFNLKELKWDSEILEKYHLSELNFPDVAPSSSDFGESNFENLFKNKISITAMIGDSHAASFGERCFTKGTAKATIGTGSSILLNTGDLVDPEKTSMVSTICWSTETHIAYALEGIIVSCGSTINWLSDQLRFFKNGQEATEIAESLDDNGNVYLIPAFSGLGAPWWKMNQKAQISGLTFGSDYRHIVRAGLESIAFQITDVIKAMEKDCGFPLESLQIDGGVSSSSFVRQVMADLNKTEILRCELHEASALGAGLLAGLKSGIFKSIDEMKNLKYTNENVPAVENKAIQNSYECWLSIIKELD